MSESKCIGEEGVEDMERIRLVYLTKSFSNLLVPV